jgi:glycosyltransferase involved in cell wall biosynthesis
MRIGIYGICKNEKDFVERCLNSVKEADVIAFCDTGSTDGTWELLQNFDHPNKIVKQICVSPWRFDDARNVALMSLPPDVDMCISIDADEMLEPGWREVLTAAITKDAATLGKIPERYNHRFKTIWDWTGAGTNISEHWHERIHARHNYRWKLPVHEVLVKSDGSDEVACWVPELMMVQKPDTTKNRGSYLPMLEQSVKEDPKRWKSLSFLAGEYMNAGRIDDAIKTMQTCLELPDSDKAFLSYQLSTIYQRKGDMDWAIISMLNAGKFAPHVREYVVYLGQVYLAAGRKSDALSAFNCALLIAERTYGYEYNPQCWGETFEEYVKSCRML